MITDQEKAVVFIIGPTATGKTDLSVSLSQKLPVEIISADSRQIYKYLDIGTAKPSKEILQQLPHHFIDILEPDETYSAGQFSLDARKIIEQIFSRGKLPLVVGGSGLYLKALQEGFFTRNITNLKIRKSLQQRLLREGSEALHQDLLNVDLVTAERIHPRNSNRILRALEVYLASGERLSELQKAQIPPPNFHSLKFGIVKERERLYHDIDQRVEDMFQRGLLREVATILEMGYDPSLNSLNTVGYKEVIQYLNGKIDYQGCVTLIKQNSRHYAKRQLTWFRPDKEIHWHKIENKDDTEKVAEKIFQMYQGWLAEQHRRLACDT
jgi:tRNA dimethylallyltransferase